MLKLDNRKTRKNTHVLPALAIGDVLLVGKFKNRNATIAGFSMDENNQPVARTDKGDHKIFKLRIARLMPSKPEADGVVRQGGSAGRAARAASGLESNGRSKRQHMNRKTEARQ